MRQSRGSIQATDAEWERYDERCRNILATVPGARRFEDELPKGDHDWILGDGSRVPSDLASLQMFIARYGVPIGCWVQS